jgi:hypothetical protein
MLNPSVRGLAALLNPSTWGLVDMFDPSARCLTAMIFLLFKSNL